MTDLIVAETIRTQVGPIALRMMGAKNLMGCCDFLQFNIGANPKKVAKVRVALTPTDTYKVTTYGRMGAVLSDVEDVYVDRLHDTLEHSTGLYLSFSRRQ